MTYFYAFKLTNLKYKNIMKKYVITVNGNKYEVEVEEAGLTSSNSVVSAPKAAPVASAPKVAPKATEGGQKVNAPMPGNILKVAVKAGDVVKKGQLLLQFEAMKMENDLTSPVDGTIAEVKAVAGNIMAAGDLLVVIG